MEMHSNKQYQTSKRKRIIPLEVPQVFFSELPNRLEPGLWNWV